MSQCPDPNITDASSVWFVQGFFQCFSCTGKVHWFFQCFSCRALRATCLSEQTGFSNIFCPCTSITLSFVLSTVLSVARHCGIEVHVPGWSSTRVSFRRQFRAYPYFRPWHPFRDNRLNPL